MINLAVINIKDISKFIKYIIVFFIIIFIIEKISSNNFDMKSKLTNIVYDIGITNIDDSLLISSYYNNKYKDKQSKLNKILISEFAIFLSEDKKINNDNSINLNENSNQNIENTLENNVIEYAKSEDILDVITDIQTVETKVIEEKNKTDTYTDVYNLVKIKNESKYTLTEDMVKPDIDFSNKNDIVIYHTHTCESYTPTEENNYVASGNFRTTDLNYSVARVGTELTNYLTNFGFNVTHNTTYHDYPAYTGSYTRSLSTITSILQDTNSEFIIDLHRDALGNNSSYAPRVQIGDDVAAQVMFVIGTDGGSLEHPDWVNNLKLAIKIQEVANQMYPGLFKPIILRNSRYNQHVSDGACIIEVGATGNTLEECNASMKYLSNVISEVMK